MSNVLVPVSDFAALVTRIEKLEQQVKERLIDGVFHYGPCLRCGYGPWDSSSANPPRACPRCHSAYWDREPRRAYSRLPADPPLATWKPRKGARFRRSRKASEVVEAAAVAATSVSAPRTVTLPPELRPPGEELIPPPPRAVALPDVVVARTVDNPMNVRPVVDPPPTPTPLPMPSLSAQLAERVEPVVHVAILPDSIVEQIAATGQPVTYDEIKAAKEMDDATRLQEDTASDNGTDGSGEAVASRQGDDGNVHERESDATAAPRSAKVESFFADAIASGLVSPIPEREAAKDETPFVAPSDAAKADEVRKDDPFWK